MEKEYYDLLVLATDDGKRIGCCAAGESAVGCVVEDSTGNLYKVVDNSTYVDSGIIATIVQCNYDLIPAKAIYQRAWVSENADS